MVILNSLLKIVLYSSVSVVCYILNLHCSTVLMMVVMYHYTLHCKCLLPEIEEGEVDDEEEEDDEEENMQDGSNIVTVTLSAAQPAETVQS